MGKVAIPGALGYPACMRQYTNLPLVLLILLGAVSPTRADEPKAADVLAGLRDFARKTARDDGSFRPGVDPDYQGMSDSAYSDLAPVTYAVVIHKTFGWTLPHEEKTLAWL